MRRYTSWLPCSHTHEKVLQEQNILTLIWFWWKMVSSLRAGWTACDGTTRLLKSNYVGGMRDQGLGFGF